MLTRYEQKLIDYWANWKSGMGPFGKEKEGVPDVKPDVELEVNLDYLAEDIRDNIWDII